MEVDAEKVSGGSHIDIDCLEHQQFGMEACPKDREDAPVPDDKKPGELFFCFFNHVSTE